MATYKSDMAETPSLKPAVSAASAGDVKVTVGSAAVDTSLAAGDLILLCKLPAYHIPVDFILESTDLDSDGTQTAAVSVGILNADEDDLVADTLFIETDTVVQDGGIKRADELDGMGLAQAATDRWIAAKVTNVAASKKAGTVRGKLFYATNPS